MITDLKNMDIILINSIEVNVNVSFMNIIIMIK